MAEWRNWQTHQTQNLAKFTLREGSTPSSATKLDPLISEPDLQFKAPVVGRFEKSFAVRRARNLIGAAKKGGRNVADNRARVGVIQQVPAGHRDRQIVFPRSRRLRE